MARRPYDSRRWALVRLKAMERDGWRCRSCGKAGRLEVDHVVPLARGGDPFNPANLQALCRSCHFAKTAAENREANPPAPEVQAWRDLVADLG